MQNNIQVEEKIINKGEKYKKSRTKWQDEKDHLQIQKQDVQHKKTKVVFISPPIALTPLSVIVLICPTDLNRH